jgi:hypothetical protein
MQNPVRIENIEELRRREGIDDAELREDVRALGLGHLVRVTLLTDDPSFAGETVVVRLTGINGSVFRGTLAGRPAAKGLHNLRAGSPVAFTTAHIHSLPKGRPEHGTR